MPIIKSAKKALRSSKRKRVFNLVRKDAISKNVKSFKKLISENKLKEAKEMFSKVQKAFDKAVKTNYIKKNTSSRKKSRLSKMLKKAQEK
jgi:small subunit ribosomal protein S20